jgi:prepilin-type N-terminal cleavage/methylation domain-containing protein
MGRTSPSLRGFTLIELLVVIAIIGVLSSVVLASLNTARMRARDARRLSDLSQLQIALETYYSDNGKYPIPTVTANTSSGNAYNANCTTNQPWGNGGQANTGPTGWIPNLAPTYIPVLPTDPGQTASTQNNCYLYTSNGTDYQLLAYGTVESYTCLNNPKARLAFDYPVSYVATNGCEKDFSFTSSGATMW